MTWLGICLNEAKEFTTQLIAFPFPSLLVRSGRRSHISAPHHFPSTFSGIIFHFTDTNNDTPNGDGAFTSVMQFPTQID